MTLEELSLFITEDLYLLYEDEKENFLNPVKAESETDTEPDEEIISPVSERDMPVRYNQVLFIVDKPLSAVPEETFKNLIYKGLNLNESDFTILVQDKVSFSNPEEVISKKIILFGTTFTGFQQKYKVHTSGNQLILLADSMDKISENVDLKRQLWAQLQLVFPKK